MAVSVSKRRALLGVMAGGLAAVAGAILFACSQTPTSVPVRTFERAQRMDSVCLQLYALNPATKTVEAIQPRGLPQNECAPTPLDTDPGQNQLFAMVTQSGRGEVAVVDLSAGALVDTQRAVPGINFLPMGAMPTDVAATPDGVMVFVASAEPNKPAIYGIPTRRILGDTPGFPRDPNAVTLGSWPVCSLPQNPGAILVVPRSQAAAPTADAGAGDAGDAGAGDAGTSSAADLPEYELMVVLPGDRRNSAKVVTIDPRPFRRGGLPTKADGTPDYDFAIPAPTAGGAPLKYDPNLTPGDVMKPGDLQPCRVTSAVELVGAGALPKTVQAGAAWDDGVKWVDGGVDLTCKRPIKGAGCGLEPCCSPPRTFPTAAPGDGGTTTPAAPTDGGAVACDDAGTSDAGPRPLDLGALDPPRLVSMVRDENLLYVADEGVPFIHVIDVTDPRAPKELAPYVATSSSEPSRAVRIKEIAISPPTRDFKRYLYAIDEVDGSLLVFDVTAGAGAPRVPMTRPHPELNPFQPLDRIKFGQPVVSVTFARNEFPLAQRGGVRQPSAASGYLCNPNPNLDGVANPDPGFFYRASSADPGISIGPRRLRGIFALATLANGRVNVIDVDDWDAPCRRPVDTTLSDLTPAQPKAEAGDFDPYHAPTPAASSVTGEAFFFGASHTPRSERLMRDDPQTGNNIPRLVAPPQVRTAASLSLATTGPESVRAPLLSTRIAFEVPDVHLDQDWSFTYEGIVPTVKGTAAVVTTEKPGDYQTLVLSQSEKSFCSAGIEDLDVGRDRAAKIAAELAAVGAPAITDPPLDKRMSDYVRFTEELLDPADPYWAIPGDSEQCWGPRFQTAPQRYDVCRATFGLAGEGSSSRDFPIIEAYSDRLVVGRFYTPGPNRAREVVGRDPSNADILRLARCCFHHQVRFEVRAANEWVAVGTNPAGSVGFFHHIIAGTGGRCVPSCDIRDSLLNGRVPAVSVVPSLAGNGRDSARAMRNPLFAVTISNPASGEALARDMVYSFTTRGQFSYLGINIAGTSTAVSPQSMRFIDPLGQIAVVDGASQGLILIDLRAVTVARAPYF
ncbi:MAG: hypothetical protein JST00_04510 [Deltaproteobacteria bacterium]|nr:hypothetical protein [Deltaproteobacteria bacterium]